MIKLAERRFLIYNSEKEIIYLWKTSTEQDHYCFEFFKNYEKLTNEQIKQNLNKSLSFKDKLEMAWKKSIFNRTCNDEKVFAGKIWRTNYLDVENNTQHKEIIDAIKSSLVTGNAEMFMGNFWYINCPQNELKLICKKLTDLEDKHKKENNIQINI